MIRVFNHTREENSISITDDFEEVYFSYKEAQEIIDRLSEILQEVGLNKERPIQTEQNYKYKVVYTSINNLEDEIRTHTIEEADKVCRAVNGVIHII